MTSKKRSIFSSYSEKLIIFMILFLVAFGSVMIMSAEMGEFAGQIGVIAKTARRQLMFIAFGIFLMIFFTM